MIHATPVARMETWMSRVPVVVGWDLWSDQCDCMIYEGMRLDRQPSEPVIGFHPCAKHLPAMTILERRYARDAHQLAEHEEESPDGPRPLHQVLLERMAEMLEDEVADDAWGHA